MSPVSNSPTSTVLKEQDYAHKQPDLPDTTQENTPDDSDTDTTAAESSNDFDWSEDDGEKPYTSDQVKAKRGRRLWLAFMKLARPVRVFLVCVIGVAILVTPLLVVNLRFRENPAQVHVHVWSLWFTIIWASSCGTYLLVDSITHIILTIMALLGRQVERLKIQLELVMAVKAWLKFAFDISWAWISLSVIRAVYQPPGPYWTIINRVMQSLFAAGIVLLVEKLFLNFIAINFHEKALAERLAENRLGLKALDRLSNAHPTSAKRFSHVKRSHQASRSGTFDLFSEPLREHKDGQVLAEESPTPGEQSSNSLQNNPPKNRQTTSKRQRRKRAMAGVIVDQVGGVIGQVALKNSKFNKDVDVGGLHSARRLARRLFSALSDVNPPRSHLVVADFHPYFRTTAEAVDAFAVFDKDGNGDITKGEMREAVQRIYRERKALVAGLKDVGSIVAKLDAVLLCVSLIIIIFICLLIFDRTNTLASLVPLATIVLGFSFVFGHSAQTLFESLIFIFSTHVFDVGDLVMIDDQVLFVREFGLFSTTFRRVDGQEIIAPNALLASTKLVHNLRRSKSMWESTNLMVSYSTPMEVIDQLRSKINTYVNANNREWSGFGLNIDKMEYQNAIHLVVAMEHRPNWQDWGGRWTRRTAFMRHLKVILEELDIHYSMPLQPVLLPPSAEPSPRKFQPPLTRTARDAFGNAGFFQADESNRAPRGVF